jgi:uncharacterized protein YsxB (DUF464 family)
MVLVDIHRDKEGRIVKYVLEGHACYTGKGRLARGIFRKAQSGGDIVCAAVSAVAQATVIGLREVAKVAAGIEITNGYLECIIPEGIDEKQREKADTVLETMTLALKDIEEQYRNHVKVNEMEV